MELIGKYLKRLNNFVENLNTVLFIVLCCIVFLQVVFRFLLKYPSPWTEEFARYLLIMISFIGVSISTREQTNIIAIDLFKDSSIKKRAINRILIHSLILIFSVLMLYGGILIVKLGHNETATSIIWIKMSYIYCTIPICFTLIILYTIEILINVILELKLK